jgi:hypothetical protein
VGVLLLNLGGPETLDDVQPFLYNLFADPDILRLNPLLAPLQPLIAGVISTLRAPKARNLPLAPEVALAVANASGGGGCEQRAAAAAATSLTPRRRARKATLQ